MNKLLSEYTRKDCKRQLVLPLETEYLIPKDEKVRLLDQVLEEMNYRGLYLTNSGKEGNSTVEPVTLSMIMVLHLPTGEMVEPEDRRSVPVRHRYRYLLQRQSVSNHNTVNRFWKT